MNIPFTFLLPHNLANDTNSMEKKKKMKNRGDETKIGRLKIPRVNIMWTIAIEI